MLIQRLFVCVCLGLLIALLPSTGRAKATAHLQSTKLTEGDIAVLVIEFENNVPSLFPLDTTPLLADFEVLQVKPSLRRKLKGDKKVNILRWEVELYPRQNGYLSIPSLKLKDQQSPELSLRVDDRNQADESKQEFYVEVSTDKDSAYVGEQIILTIRLFHSQPLSSGIIYEPSFDGVDVYSSGPDQRFRKIINDRSFTVLERKLLLFAREPGSLEIPAIEFRGEPGSGRKHRIRRHSSAFNLDIIPAIISSASNHWLPASGFEISQQWDQKQEKLFSGDSISRKVIIRANGLAAVDLPANLLSQKSAKFEVYADQPKRLNSFDDSGVRGELEQTFVIVFSEPGQIKIADTVIRWRDVSTDTEQRVSLPGKTISVSLPAIKTKSQNPEQQNKNWLYRITNQSAAIVISLAIVICFFISLWLSKRNRSSAAFNRRKLRNACMSGNISVAHEQVRNLAAIRFKNKPNPGLYDLISNSDSPQFQHQLRKLDRAVYGVAGESWHGDELWRAYRQLKSVHLSRPKKHLKQLPALYPR